MEGKRVGRANEWIGGDGGVGGFMVDGARKGRGKRETKEREFRRWRRCGCAGLSAVEKGYPLVARDREE